MPATVTVPAVIAELPEVRALESVPAEVAAAPSIVDSPRHRHSLDNLAGYVIRLTIVHRDRVEVGDRTGIDLGYVDSPARYQEALAACQAVRRLIDAYAVADCVYACGCRS